MYSKILHFLTDVEFLSIVYNYKKVVEYIHFRRFTINNFNSNLEPKGKCCTFEMAGIRAYLRKYLFLTAVGTCDRDSKIWCTSSMLSSLRTVNLGQIGDPWLLIFPKSFSIEDECLRSPFAALTLLIPPIASTSICYSHRPICSLKGESSSFSGHA